jgi:hypothetical protein
MPVRTIRQQSDATFAFTGAGWSVPTALLGATVKYAIGATNVCTITLPANHGFTGAALIGYGYAYCTANAVIAVDGVTVQAAWNQHFGALNDQKYYLPRILSQPITLNPAKGTAQIITLTCGIDGGYTYISGIELYTAAAQTAGRLVATGHSMLYGVTSAVSLAPQAGRFTTLLTSYLTAEKYEGVAWTEVNQGVPSEDLTNGSYQSGSAGGVNSAPAYAQFPNDQYYNNTVVLTPGWMRLEAGDTWPTPAPNIGIASGTFSYMPGQAQWWAQAFAVGVFMHNVNDYGYTQIYDAGDSNIQPVGVRDGAADAVAPVAGSGFALQRFLQRFREALYRAQLAITPAPRIYVIGTPNIANGGGPIANTALGLLYDNAIRGVLAEPWVKNTYFVPIVISGTGFPSNVSNGDFHPNPAGHQAIFGQLRRVHESLASQEATVVGKAY